MRRSWVPDVFGRKGQVDRCDVGSKKNSQAWLQSYWPKKVEGKSVGGTNWKAGGWWLRSSILDTLFLQRT